MFKFLKISIIILPFYFIQGCNEVSTSSDIEIKLLGDKYIKVKLHEKFIDPGAKAYSKNDGDITDKIKVTSNLNVDKEGNYTITYSVVDSKMESAMAIREVEVLNYSTNRQFSQTLIPIDSNVELGNEKGVLYYADPKEEENGLNRVIRIDYKNWTYTEIPVVGKNPHSIDRAGNTDKFYVRTQDSNSFGVVNFKMMEAKTVSLGDHKPRAIGAYNGKFNIQLLSGKNMPIVDVIDVSSDTIVGALGYRSLYNKNEITSNGGSSSATGHALWFDADHLGVIDRLHKKILVYKVYRDSNGKIAFKNTTILPTQTALHAIERNIYPQNDHDKRVFYGMGEGDLSKNIAPYVVEYSFEPNGGKLEKTGRVAVLSSSNKKVNNVAPTTHHASVTPDGKYLIVPVLDGKVYIINKESMKVAKILEAGLGAAHVTYSDTKNYAIITNHYSNFITIIDYKTLKKVKTLQIGFHQEFDPIHKHLLQPHFSYVSEDGKYFFTFATQEGKFIEVNLDTLEIERTMDVGGAPEQAHS